MKIAIPVTDGKLSMHFGHCEQFFIFEINEKINKIEEVKRLDPPAHEPGLLPKWLSELGVSCVISGGMGKRAIDLFNASKINVITGAYPEDPSVVVANYLNESLNTGDNVCDH